jgi:hypothetical protein
MKNSDYLSNEGLYSARFQRGILLTIFVFCAISSYAETKEVPRSFTNPDLERDTGELKSVAKLDVQKYLNEHETGKASPSRYAIAVDTNFTPDNSGKWRETASGRIWQLRIRSDGAQSMSAFINCNKSSKDAKLWVFSPDRKEIGGPYVFRDCESRSKTLTKSVSGSEIVVELFVPIGGIRPEWEIIKIYRGYRVLTFTPATCPIDQLSGVS